MHPRRAHRIDKNQKEIVAALREVGAWVYSIGQPYDLLVLFRNTWHVLEIKEGNGGFTAGQKRTLDDIKACGWDVDSVKVVRSVAEAIGALE